MNRSARVGAAQRTWVQACAWVALVTVLWGTDLYVKFSERDAFGVGKDDYRLVVEQVTSGLGVLAMIPLLVYWLGLFPPTRDRWPAAVVGHTFGTIMFAFGHYTLMVALRAAWYGATGFPYIWRQPFVQNLIVEYQKDIKIYFGILVIVLAWRAVVGREGGVNSSQGTTAPPLPDRLVVQTGQGTSVVAFDDIRYLEAARNYVVVHAGEREYLVRDTIANLYIRLDATRFLRTHRSFIVNVDTVREIRNVDSSTKILLDGGHEVPLSRGYRDSVKAALGR
ncbi:MAG: LytTR family transcriptional regulator [Gammaproteobacteria bacterium]|nr:LytTR family transcriptional regulator [Gammaproteobacteria bacterium]MDH4256461.1 LytTR family transcriptional regulator [Gammaproteobacteria bacterium]MDH5310078.1 LytTR family transcriptional regulator [Gammaproteobacteria bacterium]